MQQFIALYKKELTDYIKSPFAYALLAFYLILSVSCAFYFGAYLAMHDVSVYALFFAQPALLAVLIPALTMRVWSEEYKTGTIEFLFTQPLPETALVLAKTTTASCFWLMSSLFLLPFIFYTATWLKVDISAVFVSYCGLWLTIMMFCSLGCLISALSKSYILSYLIALLIAIGIVGWRTLDFYETYNNFLFASISAADILYFLIYIAVFVFLNVLFLTSHRLIFVHKNIKLTIAFALTVFAAVLFNKGMNMLLSSYRADLTTSKIYSLKTATGKIIDKIETPITIDLYISKDYADYDFRMRYYSKQIEQLLKKYQTHSKGMINVHTTKVEPFSELEKSLVESGLYYETNAGGSLNYFGAVLRNARGQAKAIAHFIPERFAFVEKDIDEAILQLYDASLVKNIGVFLDDKQNLQPFSGFLLNLENDYNVFKIDDDVYQISPELDLLILINPKNIDGNFMYAVDQYVMHGGKTIIFFDHLTRSQSEVVNFDNIRLEVLMQMWGIQPTGEMADEGKLNPKFFGAMQNVKIDTATVFDIKNPDLHVTPLIDSDKGFVGALVTGSLKSAYERSILQKEGVLPHEVAAKDIHLALIGDVDILDEATWINPVSVDQNPYSIISSAGNGQAMRFLVDYMVGNNIYNLLPVNSELINKESIGQKLTEKSYRPYAEEYEKIISLLSEKKLALYTESGEDFDKMNTLMQVTTAGEEIADIEKKADSIDYQIKQAYKKGIFGMVVINILCVPLMTVFLLWILKILFERKRLRKIKEAFHE